MKKFVLLIMIFINTFAFSAKTLSQKDWKVEVDEGSGRFLLYYKGSPVNQKDSPITTYASLRIGEKIYHLGETIGVKKVEAQNNQLTAIYQISSQLLLEMNLSFTEHPFVYDEKGLLITFRIDSRMDMAEETMFRFVLDTAAGEEKNQGYVFPEAPKKEISQESAHKKNSVIFYPFLLKAFTNPSFIYFSSWKRVAENFSPAVKRLLNFRDIRSGEWDPAITLFYKMGKVRKRVNEIKLFIGLAKKPNRNYPRVKLFYPPEIEVKNKKFTLPILVKNNGDFLIDFFKIAVSSSQLKMQMIKSSSTLKLEGKRKLILKGELIEKTTELRGKIRARLWQKDKEFEQSFRLRVRLKKPKKKGSFRKVEPEIAKPVKDRAFIEKTLEKIDLLLYFLNRGLLTGMSPDVAEQIHQEVNHLEAELAEEDKKAKKNTLLNKK